MDLFSSPAGLFLYSYVPFLKETNLETSLLEQCFYWPMDFPQWKSPVLGTIWFSFWALSGVCCCCSLHCPLNGYHSLPGHILLLWSHPRSPDALPVWSFWTVVDSKPHISVPFYNRKILEQPWQSKCEEKVWGPLVLMVWCKLEWLKGIRGHSWWADGILAIFKAVLRRKPKFTQYLLDFFF